MSQPMDAHDPIYTSSNAIHGHLHRSGSPEPASLQPTRTPTTSSWAPLFARFRKGTQDSKGSKRKSSIAQSLMKPRKPVGKAPGIGHALKAILFASWLNVLLLCIPVSIMTFSYSSLLGLATDEMSMRVGQTLAGLLNATLGNANIFTIVHFSFDRVELIVAIIAIIKCELQIVQSSLVGSILSNLLLVLGMCFFAGGMRFQEQGFGASASQINSSLLTLSVIAVLLPAAFHFAVQPDASDPSEDPLTNPQEAADITKLSHGVAIILLCIYVSYLIFQLWSHASLYQASRTPSAVVHKLRSRMHIRHHDGDEEKTAETGNGNANGSVVNSETTHAPDANLAESQPIKEEEEEVETPNMSFPMCIALLVVVTVLVAVTAEFLVDSIDGVTQQSGLRKEWVGLILLPIVGNAAEHVTAVMVSVKDKLTLSIGVAVGSSIQIALFVIPLMVVIAWGLGKPLLLLFDPFESVTLFLAVITVNYCVQDGKSNWLEGMILMCLYLIIAVSFWFYPGR
ncbi:calcium/proton exchanger [Fomitiporia mediterranea MF3/22]|uniref:calcium/proton exchanger n=1 Tax=Fomitiporia mediterranea (strain MF3/22) TaxID=694068 RepID=UPI0004408E61|nr:calcium/proton exchanger [Fomitiporia mediterranea MF3/22]EJD06395.1 calcium/proton exchanger [Fomitiporia mediterranea MF3/22]